MVMAPIKLRFKKSERVVRSESTPPSRAGTSFSAGQTTGASVLRTAQLDRGTSASVSTRTPNDPCGYVRMRTHERPCGGDMSCLPPKRCALSALVVRQKLLKGF